MLTIEAGRNSRTLSRRRLVGAALVAGALVATDRGLWSALAAQDDGGPDGYAHPDWFVDADSLLAHGDDPGLRLIAFAPPDDFAAGHIPGARRVDAPAMEIGDTSQAAIDRWRKEMARLVAALGIAGDSTVVTYDAGNLFATRPWWVLRYLGHEDVRILNGGLAAWDAAGGTVATGSAAAVATPIADTPAAGTFRSDLLAPLAEVRAALSDPGVIIVDARTPPRRRSTRR